MSDYVRPFQVLNPGSGPGPLPASRLDRETRDSTTLLPSLLM